MVNGNVLARQFSIHERNAGRTSAIGLALHRGYAGVSIAGYDVPGIVG